MDITWIYAHDTLGCILESTKSLKYDAKGCQVLPLELAHMSFCGG